MDGARSLSTRSYRQTVDKKNVQIKIASLTSTEYFPAVHDVQATDPTLAE